MGQFEDVTFAVRVRPGASRTFVGGRYDGRLGAALIVAVSAPAVDGRATAAALRATAEALRVPGGSLMARSGAASRDKLFTVRDAPRDIHERIRSLRDGSAPA